MCENSPISLLTVKDSWNRSNKRKEKTLEVTFLETGKGYINPSDAIWD